MSTSSVRSGASRCRGSRGGASRSASARSRRPAVAPRGRGERRSETPARSWTTPSWRSAAIRRRSASEASSARCSSASRSRWPRAQPARQRPGQRHLDQLQQRAARRAARARRPATAGGRWPHGAEALVGLEQQRLPVGRVDRQVDLEQLAAAALEAVLRAREVADLGVDAAGRQRLELVVAERVARADQPRLVGVDDAAVGVPQLDAHDRRRAARGARTTRSRRGERRGIARRSTPGVRPARRCPRPPAA